MPVYFKQWGEWLPWGPGDYTRCWLLTDGTQLPFEGPPPQRDAVIMTRVGKKRAGALWEGVEYKEMPEGQCEMCGKWRAVWQKDPFQAIVHNDNQLVLLCHPCAWERELEI